MKKITLIFLGILISLAIGGVNFWLIYPWFFGNGPVNLGSIEVSYVSMARFISDFYPHLSFAPYWYFGFPFNLFYTPLLPALEVVLSKLAGVPLWQAYRIISGFGFVLAPISLFLFSWYLTKKIISGILAALGYSFLPSLFYFVLPSGEVAKDVISEGFLDPRRLVILARWGEGPHTLSLAFLPLAGLFFLKTLESKKAVNLIFAALFIGLTALTNAIGLYALALLLLAIIFGELAGKEGKTHEVFKLSLITAFLAYGLISFWYNLSFLGTFFGEGGGVLKNYLYLFPWGYVLLAIVALVIFSFFHKVVKNRAVAVSFVWFLILFSIVFIYYVSAPPELSAQRLEFAPQALRLMTAADIAFAVFLAVVMGVIISFLEKKNRFLGWLGNLGGIVLAGGLLLYGLSYLPYGQKAVAPVVDLTKTAEYEIANWLTEHIETKNGERVFVAGNYSFYLNYFSNVWQLRGGLYQARTHPWPEHIFYQINNGKDKEIALAWLKAANIKYLVVNTPASQELYKEFKFPEKFTDLEEVYNEAGDIIYKVPLVVVSPAKVVNLSSILAIKPPKKADDEKPLLAYVERLDESSPASFEVINNDLYKIKAEVKEGEGILVQMAYDKGFKAKSNLGKVKIEKDPLGFMVLRPAKPGEQQITLSHHPIWKIYLGYFTTFLTFLCLILLPRFL